MNAHFKKKGAGGYTPQDLIELSFDKKNTSEVKPDLELFEKLVAKHGKRRKKKKDGE